MSKTCDGNRIKRIRAIDEMLKSSKHGVTISQLITKVKQDTGLCADRFAIIRDIIFMSEELGLDIFEEKISRRDSNNSQVRWVKTFRYRNPENSLFAIDIDGEQRHFLSQAIEMIGLKGISETRMFRNLRLKTNAKDCIISFTKNPNERKISNVFESLWRNIRNQEVVSFKMKNRRSPFELSLHRVHPWYLREYNRRWYLFGFDEGANIIMHYALDRIVPSVRILKRTYRPPSKSIDEILKHIIGVSLPETNPIEIVFWVSENSVDFVESKPLHLSQKSITQTDVQRLYHIESNLERGKFFKIFCKNNYELRRELLSFGDSLIVLYPNELRAQLIANIQDLLNSYLT